MSLNLRIILSATLVLIFFITLTAITLERAFFESTESALKDKLESQLYLLMAETEVDDQGKLTLPAHSLEASLYMPNSGLYAQINGHDKRMLWTSGSTLGATLPEPESLSSGHKIFKKLQLNHANYYHLSHGVNWDTGARKLALTFHITSDLASFNKQINRYRKTLWGWLVAMALLLLVSQTLILHWGLWPLRKVSMELKSIENGQQDRVQGQYPQELKRLTDKINVLFKQERQQKDRYRNALGDLAHSLKTPLAVMQNWLNGADKKSAATLSEQLTRMNRIVEYQLQRAATAGSTQTGSAIALHATTEKIAASLQKVYHDKNIYFKNNIDPALQFQGDEGDLMEILGNLLDNGFKWALQRIEINAEQYNRQLRIIVHDDGPGMNAEQINSLLQRGVRADENIAGHGIGLSIVNSIVEAYQGSIEVDRSPMGGARIVLTI